MSDTETKPVLPDAFTADRQVFDETPPDEALYALIGSKGMSQVMAFEDSPRWLTARPKPLPLKVMIPFLVVVMLGMTGGLIYKGVTEESDLRVVVWAMIPILWLLILPTVLGILSLMNHQTRKQPDFFQFDKTNRRLILPRAELEIGADDILEIVELRRRHQRTSRSYTPVCLTSVLFRNGEGRIEQRPIGYETVQRVRSDPAAPRLAELLDKPVRRINLGYFASKGLGDE